MMGTMTRKPPPELRDGDAWTGGWYELAIQLGPRNDVQLQAAISILARMSDPLTTGPRIQPRHTAAGGGQARRTPGCRSRRGHFPRWAPPGWPWPRTNSAGRQPAAGPPTRTTAHASMRSAARTSGLTSRTVTRLTSARPGATTGGG